MISKPEWRTYLDHVSKGLVGSRAEVDVMSLKLGSQVQAHRIRLLGITYDPKNDLLEVALEGLDHLISKPIELYVEEGHTGLESLSVLDGDGNRQIIRLDTPINMKGLDSLTNVITPAVGAAGTAAGVGMLVGAELDKQTDPEPIADPLQAAAEIEREEEQRGEVKPVKVIPEPGDVAVPTEPTT